MSDNHGRTVITVQSRTTVRVDVTFPSDRAVSPVISVILMVAVTVILAAVIATFVLGLGEDVQDPGPNVGQTSGELESNAGGNNNGVVRIWHEAGAVVDTADMEVVVDATDACDKRGRLVNLPVDETNGIESTNVDGADIFDQRPMGLHPLDSHGALERAKFLAGDRIQFRIPSGKCSISENDEVVVRIVHTPTNAVIVRQRLIATPNDGN